MKTICNATYAPRQASENKACVQYRLLDTIHHTCIVRFKGGLAMRKVFLYFIDSVLPAISGTAKFDTDNKRPGAHDR